LLEKAEVFASLFKFFNSAIFSV